METVGRYATDTMPPLQSGTQVRTGGCPQNMFVSEKAVVIIARGCTEDEAKKKVYKELLKRAKKIRQDRNAGDCVGTCEEGGECTLTTPIGAGELTCYPADVPGCDGGFVCIYIAKVRAECVCAL
jgi:hypothetical protein